MAKTNNFSFTSLRFPQELGTDEVPAYVRFTPQAVQYGGSRALGRPQGGQLGVPTTRGVPRRDNTIGGVAESLGRVAQGLLEFPGRLASALAQIDVQQILDRTSVRIEDGNIRVVVDESTVNRGLQTLPDQVRSEGSISLFLPEELATNNGVSYDAAELGAAGSAQVTAAAQANLEGQVDVGRLFEGVVGGSVTDLLKDAGNLRAVNAVATGRVQNPFSYQIFNGVEHRSFSYSFKMVPKNSAEALEVKRITDMFLYYMLPARAQESGLHFYEIPVQWQIEYYKQSDLLEYHQQPNSCFLKSVNVGYGGEGKNALHNDGSPIVTTVDLEFVEIEPLYRDRIPGSFKGPDNLAGGGSNR